jgi:undecaprenyl diphosphate synthase
MGMIYSDEQLATLNLSKVPKHIAMIMDGNRRWARQNDLPDIAGHWKGASTLTNIVQAASDLGVRILTVFAFSTENWNRDAGEVSALMHLIKQYLILQKEPMIQQGVRLQTIGNTSQMPPDVQAVLEETKKATDTREVVIDLVLALNYGGRDDIRRAFVSMMQDF